MNITKNKYSSLHRSSRHAGSIVVERAKARERLLSRLDTIGDLMVASIGDICIVFGADAHHESEVWPVSIICVGMSLWFLIQFHAAGVNRRLDALIELLEADKKKDKTTPNKSRACVKTPGRMDG